MITDPYSILGVSKNATNDEIKKAYRELSKKYHPDSHMNNPLSDLAEEKFKEIQLAYDQIMNNSTGSTGSYASNKGSWSGGSSSSSSNSSTSHSSSEDSYELNGVYNLLYERRYQEALRELGKISNHSARWFYLSAVANNGLGNNVIAFEHARQAAIMEPTNRDYQNLVNQLQFRTQRYQNTGNTYGRSTMGSGNFCCDLLCADALCECLGGDLCSCF
jgi:molecular chaperone DnaJ